MTFAEQFAEAGGDEIEVDGRVLRRVWRQDTGNGRLRIERIAASSTRPQGLVVDADADLTVAGHTGRHFVLWAHNSPPTVEIEVERPTEIRVWNVWADNEMTQAWLGWAAIHAETDGHVTRLECSDGHAGDLDAGQDDLVIDLTVE